MKGSNVSSRGREVCGIIPGICYILSQSFGAALAAVVSVFLRTEHCTLFQVQQSRSKFARLLLMVIKLSQEEQKLNILAIWVWVTCLRPFWVQERTDPEGMPLRTMTPGSGNSLLGAGVVEVVA
eukprot:5101051-Amphidinium_carterae.1